MNKRLLFLSVSLLMSVVSMAQWNLPVPEKFEPLTVEYDPALAANVVTAVEPSTYYYLYNKATGLFMTQGNSWQTQASVGTNPLKVYFVSEFEGDDTEIIIKTWSSDRTSYAWRTLFIDSETSCFVDHNTQADYYWYWEDMGDNTYRFFGSAMNTTYNAYDYPDCYFGYDLHGSSSFTGPLNSMLDITNVPEGHTYCVDWQLVSEEEFSKIADAYNAAIPGAEFLNRVNYAKTLGDINTSRYDAYLNDAATTTEQFDSLRTILNATISLKESVNAAAEKEPKINTAQFVPFYSGEDVTPAEMDSVRNILNAAISLSDYINEVSEKYTEIDVTEAEALLSKADWTAEEITKMTNNLKTQARHLDVAVYLDGASEEDPRDATMLLENPRFDTGNIDGWTVTIQGQNIGYQETSGNFSDVELPDGTIVRGYRNTDRNGYYSWLYKFIESWAPSATLPDGTIHQVITGLPSGKYTFSCDAIATYQPDANRQPQGVYLFARSSNYEFREPIFSGNEAPEHFELTFISVNDTIMFGLLAEGANTNWLAADNFEITYYGPVADNPYKIALDAMIASYEEQYSNVEDIMANAGVKEAYENAMTDAMDASANGSTDDDYLTASNALTAAASALAASIKDYEFVNSQIARCTAEQERFEGTTFEGLGNLFEDLKMSLDDGYNDGNAEEVLAEFKLGEETYSTTIAELSDFINKIVVDYITEHVQAGDEITLLINNPDFETNASGWSGRTPAWGGLNSSTSGQGVNTTAEYADLELRGGGCAEVYCSAFDTYQVVRNLPKGSYTLTVQAYERNEDGYLEQWARGPEVGISAELYCNNFVKKLHNVMAFAQPQQIYSTADPTWASDRNADGLYQPNCMTGANFYFNLEEDRSTYENKINFVLTEDGDSIVIGIRTTSNRGWVLFDNFRLIYNGAGKSIYQETVDDLKAQLASIVGTEEAPVAAYKDVKDDASQAIKDLDAVMADDTKDGDDVLAVIADANEVLKEGKVSVEIYNQLAEANMSLGENFDNASLYLTDDKFAEASELSELVTATIDNCDKNNEEVEALIAEINIMIAYLNEAVSLQDDLSNADLDLAEALETYRSTANPDIYDAASALLDELDAALGVPVENDELKALIEKASIYAGMLAAPDRSALLPADVADASADNIINVSGVIENGTFDTVGDFHGWSSGFGAGGATGPQAECYMKGFDVYQDIAGLPAGYYIATVQGYYRHGYSGTDWTRYNEEDKSGHRQTYFYVASEEGSKQTEVVYASSAAVPSSTSWVSGSTSSVGDGLVIPNSMAAATNWINQKDEESGLVYQPNKYYNHALQIHVGESGYLRIGVKKDGYDDGDWALFDNFMLYFVGSEAIDLSTGISTVSSAPAIAVQGIYNLQGQKLGSLQRGLNIVNGKKVLVK